MPEDFNARFKDLLNMDPKRANPPLDVELEFANLDIFFTKEHLQMTFNHVAKSMYTFKGIGNN